MPQQTGRPADGLAIDLFITTILQPIDKQGHEKFRCQSAVDRLRSKGSRQKIQAQTAARLQGATQNIAQQTLELSEYRHKVSAMALKVINAKDKPIINVYSEICPSLKAFTENQRLRPCLTDKALVSLFVFRIQTFTTSTR